MKLATEGNVAKSSSKGHWEGNIHWFFCSLIHQNTLRSHYIGQARKHHSEQGNLL
jgi:hypothetical protein